MGNFLANFSSPTVIVALGGCITTLATLFITSWNSQKLKIHDKEIAQEAQRNRLEEIRNSKIYEQNMFMFQKRMRFYGEFMNLMKYDEMELNTEYREKVMDIAVQLQLYACDTVAKEAANIVSLYAKVSAKTGSDKQFEIELAQKIYALKKEIRKDAYEKSLLLIP